MTDVPRKLLSALSEIVHGQTASRVAVVVGSTGAYVSTTGRLIIEHEFVHELNSEDVRAYERDPPHQRSSSKSRFIQLDHGDLLRRVTMPCRRRE